MDTKLAVVCARKPQIMFSVLWKLVQLFELLDLDY